MKLLGFLLLACLVLAVARAAMIVVALLIGLGIVMMFIENPKGTLVAVLSISGMAIFAAYPGYVASIIITLALIKAIKESLDHDS